MSLPTLTPLDTPIFDEDVIGELEEHFAEHVPCKYCDVAAAVRVRMRCCNSGMTTWCVEHRVKKRAALSRLLLMGSVRCGECRRIFAPLTGVDEVIAEVSL